MKKRSYKRFKIKAFNKMRGDVFDLKDSGLNRSFFLSGGGLTLAEARRKVSQLSDQYPAFRFRIKKNGSGKKGFSPFAMAIGFVIFIFSLAVANGINEIFSFSSEVNDLLQIGFLALGIVSLIAGLMVK